MSLGIEDQHQDQPIYSFVGPSALYLSYTVNKHN